MSSIRVFMIVDWSRAVYRDLFPPSFADVSHDFRSLTFGGPPEPTQNSIHFPPGTSFTSPPSPPSPLPLSLSAKPVCHGSDMSQQNPAITPLSSQISRYAVPLIFALSWFKIMTSLSQRLGLPQYPLGLPLDALEPLVQSGDVRDALSYCLRLIAKEAPTEFNNQVYKTLPHWIGKYHPQDFLGFKFNLWDIPSREDVAHALDFLNIHDFVWKLPELWAYPDKFYRELGDIPIGPRPEDAERCQYDAEYENPTRLIGHFDYRYRDTIRFSATATAIRFLNRLPVEQRTRIRRITLHEDSPSVNMPSLHARGLVPLYKENPLLQVERRVSVFGCIHSCAGAEKEWMTRDKPRSLYGPTFLLTLESWLIDALSMRDLDIPSGSFIFNLWGGSYGDLCTEVFQGCIHMALAEGPAFDKCCELDLFSSTTNQLSATPDKFFLDPRFREAVKHLVNKTSILRSDFHPGVPVDPNVLVEETKGMDDVGRRISRWDYHGRSFGCKIPADLYYDFILPPQFEFQTREQYIESRGGRVTGQDS
ncbi:uncharacterized protein FPRO_09037 [Fusarium proliferatum ET1]|uniref:Uncharacterized protein n=1 Tax=Fusarium proliferatum (strain ET1) TaxID=1227346 RepID=A0A1L7W9F2_FUSPR|nr:uncharacterized protein FPRO_09037 [Fusarium proliferatum ET1]CZR49221.1 uncharacterized protein FPRO_09037 [Fusarium proliferatum ET1]